MVENVSLEKHKAKLIPNPIHLQLQKVMQDPPSKTEVARLNSFLPFLDAASCPFKSFLLGKTSRRPQTSGPQKAFPLTNNQANYFAYVYICFLIPLFPLLKKKTFTQHCKNLKTKHLK